MLNFADLCRLDEYRFPRTVIGSAVVAPGCPASPAGGDAASICGRTRVKKWKVLLPLRLRVRVDLLHGFVSHGVRHLVTEPDLHHRFLFSRLRGILHQRDDFGRSSRRRCTKLSER